LILLIKKIKLLRTNLEDISKRQVNDPVWRKLRLIISFNGGANFKRAILDVEKLR